MRGPAIVLSLVLVAAITTPAIAQAAARQTDDEFIESLGSESPRPVDRRRLAKVMFGLASTLDGDKSSVRLVQSQVAAQDGSRRAVHGLLEMRYGEYTETLARFKRSVSDLLDEPDSVLLFFRVFMEGQRTCWQLDMHNLLIEAYGGGAGSLSTLSSREACGRFRTAVFQPRVEAILRDALVDRIFQEEEIRTLRRDVRDLEQLLADLREIEESE
jgi:hypothetical protein